MLKKIGFGIVALLLIAIGFVWVKYVIPLQSAADRFGPDSVARDYALQDDSRVTAPTAAPAAYAELHDPDMRLYWGELHINTAESLTPYSLVQPLELKTPIALPKASL